MKSPVFALIRVFRDGKIKQLVIAITNSQNRIVSLVSSLFFDARFLHEKGNTVKFVNESIHLVKRSIPNLKLIQQNFTDLKALANKQVGKNIIKELTHHIVYLSEDLKYEQSSMPFGLNITLHGPLKTEKSLAVDKSE